MTRDEMVAFYLARLPQSIEVCGRAMYLKPPEPQHAFPAFIYHRHDMFDCPDGGQPGLFVSFTPSLDDDLVNADIAALWVEKTILSAQDSVREHEAQGCKLREEVGGK